MKFLEYIEYIKKYLNETQTDPDYCDTFYASLRRLHVTFNEENYESNFYWEVLEIEEQAEPWNDVQCFEPLDNQLRELLKKYNL